MPVTTSFGGADATLVTAATRASFASAPKDYSKAFQGVADSYHKMATSNAEVWGKVMMAAGAKLKEAKDRFDNDPAQSTDEKDAIKGKAGEQLTSHMKLLKERWYATFSGRDMEEYIPNDKYDPDKAAADSDYNVPKEIKNPNYKKRKLLGFLNANSEENKKIRNEILKEKNDAYASFEQQVDAFKGIEKLISLGDKPGGIWAAASGNYATEGVNALSATFRDEVTGIGNYLVYEKDDKNKWKFTMYNDATRAESYDPATNSIADPNNKGERINLSTEGDDYHNKPTPVLRNGEKIRHTAKEYLNMLTLKPQVDGAGNSLLQKAMEKDFTGVQALGYNSLTGQMDAIQKAKAYSISKKYSDNPAAWHTQTFVGGIAEGEGSRSFFEEATNASGLNAILFNAANQHMEWKEIASGMTNVEGTSPEIDEADFAGGGEVARRNLLGLQAALFNPSHANYSKEGTGKVFENWLNKKMDKLFDLSFESKGGGNGNGDGDDGKIPDIGSVKYSGIFEGGNNAYLDQEDRSKFNKLANNINKRASMGKDGIIYWDKDKESYFHKTQGVIPNKGSMFQSFFQKQIADNLKNPMVETQATKFWKNIKDWDGTEYMEGNGNGNGNGNGKTKKIITLEDDDVERMWMGGVTWRDIKKINGTWHIKTGYSFGENEGYTKATAEQIKKISKKYK